MQHSVLTIGIAGIGQMGCSAAVAFQRAGHRVLLWARNADRLRAVQSKTDELLKWSEDHLGPALRLGGSIHLEEDLHRLDAESDVFLDCILEILDEKIALFQKLTLAQQRGALLLSATSGLSITQMGRGAGCESLLVGAHFWNPPHLIPVVEMVFGEKTPDAIFQQAYDLMTDIGKIPVRCRDVPGFIGNRLMHAMWREALALVDAGVCTAAEIDRIVKLTFALRLPSLGPMENMDLVGLDAVQRIHRYLLPELADNTQPADCLDDKVRAGQLGMRSGQGFYDWSQRDAEQVVRNRDLLIVRQLEALRELGEL